MLYIYENKINKALWKIDELYLEYGEMLAALLENNSIIIDNSNNVIKDIPENTSIEIKNDQIKIPVEERNIDYFLKHCHDRNARKIVFEKYQNLHKSTDFAKKALNSAKEILKQRQKIISWRRYKNHASYALRYKCEKSPEIINEFLENSLVEIKNEVNINMDTVEKLAKSKFKIKKVKPWDIPYIISQSEAEIAGEGAKDFKNFFTLDNAIKKLINVVESLYNISYERVAVEENLFLIKDNKTQKHLASFKVIVPTDELIMTRSNYGANEKIEHNGKALEIPMIRIFLNLKKPKDNAPYLLTFKDLVDFFHEKGHGLENLFYMQDKPHRQSYLQYDIIEVSSKFMENFVYDWELIKELACHYKDNRAMTKDVFDAAVKYNKFSNSFHYMYIIHKSMIDLNIDNNSQIKMSEIIKDIQKKTEFEKLARFNIIMERGIFAPFDCDMCKYVYRTNYYCYLYSEIVAHDIYQVFKKSSSLVNQKLGEKLKNDLWANMDNFLPGYTNFTTKEKIDLDVKNKYKI